MYKNCLRRLKNLQHGRKIIKPEFNKGSKASKVKCMWIRKEDHKLNVAHISLKAIVEDIWYLDSNYSKQMTGKKEFVGSYQQK
jgi:hypothetical protein